MYCNMRKLVLAISVAVFSNMASAQENASNPLAAVNNTDLRWKYTSTSGRYRHDLFVDGAYMLMPKLKLKYELHYNITDLTGTRQQDFEKIVIKPIYFPYQTLLGEPWAMKVAVGMDVSVEFGNQGKAIGVGADQLGPFAGLAFSNMETGLALIPLVQHFTSINGPTDVNTTAARVIALQPFGDGYWAKADVIVPYDWENHKWPVTAEMQVGKNINSRVALYADGLVGLGGDRPFDAGVGFGLRFKY